MSDWAVPVGQPLGIASYSDDYAVRTGESIEELDEFELLAWAATVGTFEDPPQWLDWELAQQRVSTAHTLVEPALGAAPGSDYLERLQQRHVVTRVGKTDLDVQRFFATHRFQASLVGLWRSPADPNRQFVGFDDDAVLSLGPEAYAVYVEAAAHPTVQDACVAVAMRGSPAPEQYADRMLRLREAFMGTARTLVVTGGGFFDRTVR